MFVGSFLELYCEEDINSMSSLDRLSQSSGSCCSRGIYNDSRNNAGDKNSQEAPHPHLEESTVEGSQVSWIFPFIGDIDWYPNLGLSLHPS